MNRQLSTEATELFDALQRELGCKPFFDHDGPEIGVFDPDTGDIIGSGESESEALADALQTVRGWR